LPGAKIIGAEVEVSDKKWIKEVFRVLISSWEGGNPVEAKILYLAKIF
jgi:hypothetical protein